MTDTTVQYHSDGFGPGRPAINVKVHAAGLDFWPKELLDSTPGTSQFPATHYAPRDYDRIVSEANDRVASDFWQAAEEIATQRGLGEIGQEGRSGGWLVFTDGRDPQEPDTFWLTVPTSDMADRDAEIGAWFDGYRAMVEWANAYIADAPRKVRSIAQDMAMDEAGEGAARRFFAYGVTRP